MVKSEKSRTRGRVEEGVQTRARMVDAALATLIDSGYSGCSARAIAARGGFNAALIFYHYGGVDELLLAALDKSSAERLERYREALSSAGNTEELVRRASQLFRQSIDEGHVTALTELMSASLAKTGLQQEIVARMEPWLELARLAIERVLAGASLQALSAAAAPAAYALVSGYLGLNMLSRLMPDRRQTDALFALLEELAKRLPENLSAPPARGQA